MYLIHTLALWHDVWVELPIFSPSSQIKSDDDERTDHFWPLSDGINYAPRRELLGDSWLQSNAQSVGRLDLLRRMSKSRLLNWNCALCFAVEGLNVTGPSIWKVLTCVGFYFMNSTVRGIRSMWRRLSLQITIYTSSSTSRFPKQAKPFAKLLL